MFRLLPGICDIVPLQKMADSRPGRDKFRPALEHSGRRAKSAMSCTKGTGLKTRHYQRA